MVAAGPEPLAGDLEPRPEGLSSDDADGLGEGGSFEDDAGDDVSGVGHALRIRNPIV